MTTTKHSISGIRLYTVSLRVSYNVHIFAMYDIYMYVSHNLIFGVNVSDFMTSTSSLLSSTIWGGYMFV